jgi:hypothetical protein
MHDPILEEMGRVKRTADIKESRFRDWCDYLHVALIKKDEEIASLRAQLEQRTVKRG